MPAPGFETASGIIDGVNTVFSVSQPYLSGTTAVFVNGQLKRRDLDDGWVETSPSTGTLTLNIAPLVGDVVQVFYLAVSNPDERELTPISGTLSTVSNLSGTLSDLSLVGVVAGSDQLSGTIAPEDLSGVLTSVDELVGVLDI